MFGCHLWTGAKSANGYAVTPDGKSAARDVLEQHLGRKLPARVFPDHCCRRPLCVRAEHLEPVTKGENERRKSPRYRQFKVTRCPEGHLLSETGITTPEGGRVCRTCCGLPW